MGSQPRRLAFFSDLSSAADLLGVADRQLVIRPFPRWTTSLKVQPNETSIRFSTFPRTVAPPQYAIEIRAVFRKHAEQVSTVNLEKGLTSGEALAVVRPDLVALGLR